MAKVTTGVNGNNLDLYPQTRGSNGQFGKRQASSTANPLTHYTKNVNGVERNMEKRKITDQAGNKIPTRTFTAVSGGGNGYQGPGF